MGMGLWIISAVCIVVRVAPQEQKENNSYRSWLRETDSASSYYEIKLLSRNFASLHKFSLYVKTTSMSLWLCMHSLISKSYSQRYLTCFEPGLGKL